MPTYDYECASCGPFSEIRPMAQSAARCDCPDCGAAAPRVFLAFPSFASMDVSTRTALSRNEKSAHEPVRSKAAGKHAPGCGCCGGKSKKLLYRPDGSKSFPSNRPWMISH